MTKKRSVLISFALAAAIGAFFFFSKPSDGKVAQSLEALLPKLEPMGLTAYRNQDWCKVLAYQGKAFSNTGESTCTFVTKLPTVPFSSEASAQLKEVADILSGARVKIRSVENIQTTGGKIVFAEFHADCFFCRTRYVFNPGYGTLPSDEANERRHFRINSNWYRVEEDWN